MVNLKNEIMLLWADPVQSFDDCLLEKRPGPSDANDVQNWVDGLSFSAKTIQILADSDEMEVETPFFYVKDSHLDLFAAVYIVNIVDTIIEGFGVDYSTIHFVGFLESNRVLPYYSTLCLGKKWVLFLIVSKIAPLLDQDVFSIETRKKINNLTLELIEHDKNLFFGSGN